eukprot:GFUD01032653.1.p1 GENE.GFUD01032653.1~~GFUD01032653.1.p1  ORF type:complete len:182 (+),score=51.26 GFUD01032653.1:185-730(+)
MDLNISYLMWSRQDNDTEDCIQADEDDSCESSTAIARDHVDIEEGKNEEITILDLPEDIILLFFQYLPPKDLISLESSSCLLRGLIIHYCVYKARLDKIFKLKRLNNYMLLSEAAYREKTGQEISGYYKTRLYQYTYRLRLKPIEEEDDDYIQTYKVGKKKQELDELVAKNLRRFSLTGIV